MSRATAAVLAMLFAGLAHAQALRDPMRPPDAVSPQAAGETRTVVQSAASGLRLTKSMRRSKQATIDGQTVKVGEKVGDSVLLDVTDSTAVLRTADGERITLHMFPEVQKRMRPTQAAQGKG